MLFANQFVQLWRQQETLRLYPKDFTYDLYVSNGYFAKIRYIKIVIIAIDPLD